MGGAAECTGLISTTITFVADEPQPSIPGDLDEDEDVDAADRTLFLSTYRKCSGDQGYLSAADYDGDGCITLNDYREWYRYYKDFLNQ